MNIDKTILNLHKRLELEMANADPTKKGCYGTLAYTKDDSICLNCGDYAECGIDYSKNMKTNVQIIEEELLRIDEKYVLDSSRIDDSAVADINWVDIIVAFAKNKPKDFKSALEVYFQYLTENPDIDEKGKHRVLVSNAESYVERVLDGLQDKSYIVWNVESANEILWKKA